MGGWVVMDAVVVEKRGYSSAPGLADLLAKCGRVLQGIFGCWHSDMNSPFTRDGETYRVCMSCGARRRFDLERWETVGPFYYEEPRPTSGAPRRGNNLYRKRVHTASM